MTDTDATLSRLHPGHSLARRLWRPPTTLVAMVVVTCYLSVVCYVQPNDGMSYKHVVSVSVNDTAAHVAWQEQSEQRQQQQRQQRGEKLEQRNEQRTQRQQSQRLLDREIRGNTNDDTEYDEPPRHRSNVSPWRFMLLYILMRYWMRSGRENESTLTQPTLANQRSSRLSRAPMVSSSTRQHDHDLLLSRLEEGMAVPNSTE